METRVRAIAYLTRSREWKIDGALFLRRKRAIEEYAKAAKLQLVGEYVDIVAGTNEWDDRRRLAALLDRLESDGVKIVLVPRADGLARDPLVYEVLLGQFREMGVAVIAADSGTDLTVVGDDDFVHQLIRQVLGTVAKFDKCVPMLKLRAARQRKRLATGRCEGRKPFGTRPGEAETLTRIRELRRKPRKGKRLSFAKIADTLNDEDRPTRGGKPWRPGSVHAILRRVTSR